VNTVQTLWTIEDLVGRANEVFQKHGLVAPNGRVRELVSPRLVRLYTTLGLIDRPVLRGRTGFYGIRHLMQLVAIKRLQSEGWSLAEIQNRLLALSDEELEQIAQLPKASLSESERTVSAPKRPPARAFWKLAEAPAPSEAVVTTPALQTPQVKQWSHVTLAPGCIYLSNRRSNPTLNYCKSCSRQLSHWQGSCVHGTSCVARCVQCRIKEVNIMSHHSLPLLEEEILEQEEHGVSALCAHPMATCL
jgi:DNA-binding transcriptional MerR regulator